MVEGGKCKLQNEKCKVKNEKFRVEGYSGATGSRRN